MRKSLVVIGIATFLALGCTRAPRVDRNQNVPILGGESTAVFPTFGISHRIKNPQRRLRFLAQNREDVVASLERAGVRIAESPRDTDLHLLAEIGGLPKTHPTECGAIRNIRFTLSTNGVPAAIILAKGKLRCDGNMVDQVSLELNKLLTP